MKFFTCEEFCGKFIIPALSVNQKRQSESLASRESKSYPLPVMDSVSPKSAVRAAPRFSRCRRLGNLHSRRVAADSPAVPLFSRRAPANSRSVAPKFRRSAGHSPNPAGLSRHIAGNSPRLPPVPSRLPEFPGHLPGIPGPLPRIPKPLRGIPSAMR